MKDTASPPDSSEFSVRDQEAFARNMARLAEEGGKVLAAIAAPRDDAQSSAIYAEEMKQATATLSEIAVKWLARPQRAMEAQNELWRGYLELWTAAL